MTSRFKWTIDPFRQNQRLSQQDQASPPSNIIPFYWHYARQVWPWLILNLSLGFIAAVLEVSLFLFLSNIIDLVQTSDEPEVFFKENGWQLITMALIALFLRPASFILHAVVSRLIISPSFATLVGWQAHRYVLRQSYEYFQNDFAGRIASRIMQTAPSLRESILQATDALWFVAIYSAGALFLFGDNDWRLTIPLLIWIASLVAILGYFIPRIRSNATDVSEARSALTGRIVDTYTNIHAVKLFTAAGLEKNSREDEYAREAFQDHMNAMRKQMSVITIMESSILAINGLLVVLTGALTIFLWSAGEITVGVIALALGLTIRVSNMAGWVISVMTGIFEDVGIVHEGMQSIAQPHGVVDAPSARPLHVSQGMIKFENICFQYGNNSGGVRNLNLEIAAGERVGIVGMSGAGKSTLANILMRMYDLEDGRILIDGQDIALVTQDSLRENIGLISQDTSLLHRSVTDNIRYGRPNATNKEIIDAARAAQALEFIETLEDKEYRRGFDAHVGERGVKLSGGQRQRIAIARVLLKDAPILVLDEATSALDSEVESAIQRQLNVLMSNKTVIAIAHRLSTVVSMDRLIVMENGSIVAIGKHSELINQSGIYAKLWQKQTSGFSNFSD